LVTSDADSIDQAWGSGSVAKALGTPRWQVNTRGRKVLEMTDSELLASYKAGKVTAKSLIWSEGMSEWAPLGEVPRMAALIRADSVPPASGTRKVSDDAPHAGATSYASPGSEPPTSPGTSPGTIAVYERPLATIDFSDSDDAPESSDEPTPAFGMPSKAAVEASLKNLGPPEPLPGRTTLVDGVFEPASPLPPVAARSHSAFPAPVIASPLGAALTSTVTPTLPPPSDGYATAKATSPIAKHPVAKPPTWGPAPVVVRTSLPAPAAPAAPAAAVPKPFAPPPPALPVVDKPVTATPPRPAIEFLPPIIVQEKDDDGASMLELPLQVQVPLENEFNSQVVLQDVPFRESTLVLAGRRPRRWVPLGAAIAAALGAACLASALTALIVKTRPEPPPRIVEKRVLVPAPTRVIDATARALAAPAPASEAPAAAAKEAKAPSTPEPSAVKNEASALGAKPSWKREDPGALDATHASTESAPRRGFPTSPGF
jgi:hypothetical protein